MKTQKSFAFSIFLCLGFFLASLSVRAQIKVGSCTGATHATLQDAFNAVMSGPPISGTYSINICPGTYVDQPASLGVVPYAPSGGKLLIRKAPTYYAPVVLQANTPGLHTLIELNGSQNVEIENITFEVLNTSGRTGYSSVKLRNGAGEVKFLNCTFDAYSLNASGAMYSGRMGYSAIVSQERDGDLELEGCNFQSGGVGVYSWTVSPTAADKDLIVNDCHFNEQAFGGIVITTALDSVIIQDSRFDSHGTFDTYYGVESDYEASEYFEANHNEFDISHKDFAWALADKSFAPRILDNDIYGNEVYKEFKGVSLPGFITEGRVADNNIQYYRGFNPESTDSSAVGIYIRAIDMAQGSFPGTQWIEVEDNFIVLDNYQSSKGIWIEGKRGSVEQYLHCRDNRVLFNGTKFINGVNVYGIRLEGNGISSKEIRIEDNRVVSYFGIPPIVSGISVHNLELDAPMVLLNNEVEIDKTREFSHGIHLKNLSSASGLTHYVGNNTVSFRANSLINRGITLQDIVNFEVHHNSVNLWGTFGSSSSSIALNVLGSSSSLSNNNGIWNNILSNTTGGKAININQPASVSRNNYNLLYNNSSSNLAGYNGSVAANLAAWQSLSSDAANSLNGNPLYVSTTDLHISAASPAYQNAVMKVYPIYASPLTKDFEGNPRGLFNQREIGADELGGPFHQGPFKTLTAPASSLKLWPNPSSGLLNLDLPTAEQGWTLQLLDLSGKIMLRTKGHNGLQRLNLEHLPAGTYMLQAISYTQVLSQKVILN